MDAREIKERLADQAEAVCRHLLPQGKRNGSEWRCGSLNGDPGTSLGVHLNHGQAGVFCDFASGEKGGNLLELWIQVRKTDYKTALSEAKQWLGVPDFDTRFHAKQVLQKPLPKPEFVPLKKDGAPWEYLTANRKLDPDVLELFGVSETIAGKGVVFPFKNSDGTLVHFKRMALERDKDGRKVISASKGTQLCLFGKNTVLGGELTICEGEIDALSVASIGGQAVSVPNGAQTGNEDWIDHDWDWLETFHTINVLMDMDEPGQKAALAIIQRLGKERCRLVSLPLKDANEMLVAGRQTELSEAIRTAKSFDPVELRNAGEYRDEVWNNISRKAQTPDGIEFIWPIEFRIRPAELTVWTGFSGHGKSALLNQLMVHLASKGEKVCIASFEVRPSKTLEILTRQTLGTTLIGRPDYDRALSWLSQQFWLYHHVGSKHWKDLIDTFRYAHRRYQITQFVIDSLLKCGIGSEDYEGQKQIVDALTDFVNSTNSHVHLVAHSKKKEDESKPPGKLDVKGASELTDMAFNGVTVWRDKRKEEKLNEAAASKNEQAFKDASALPDGRILMWKQRETGDEPSWRMFYNREIMQFSPNADQWRKYA